MWSSQPRPSLLLASEHHLLMFMIWVVRSRISVIFAVFALVSFSALEGGWGQGANHRLLKRGVRVSTLPSSWAARDLGQGQGQDRVKGLGWVGYVLAQGTLGGWQTATGSRSQGLHGAAVILPEELIKQGRIPFQALLSLLQLRLLLSH